MLKSLKLISLVGAALFLFPHGLRAQEAPAQEKPAPEKIIYAGSPGISVPVIVALAKGYFAEEGLEVEYETIETGKLGMEALLAGRADFASVVATNLVYAGFQTDALRVIASYGVSLDDAVMFPADSPIQKPADLKGKKIGLAASTSSQAFLIRLLEKNGMSWGDITPVPLQPPAGAAALIGGQIDAFVTWQPWRTAIRKAFEGKVREIENDGFYPRQSFCAATQAWLDAHPGVAEKLLRALIRAEADINLHPEESARIVAVRTEQDMAFARSYVVPPFRVDMNKDILPLVTSYAEWVVKNQEEFIGKPLPDYGKNLATGPMKAVVPERVGEGM
ncbi:MAG: NrtA/SsuA/CpmA family ABC transporter substrate-binding protein [Alphaproteobacteria bacterium]